MSLGSLYLQVKQKYGHGLQVAHFRDRIRPQILETRPITQKNDRTCEIHALTSATDWLNLIWALKSFYHYSRRDYALCIHDDGSLDKEHYDIFYHHFPDYRVIDRPSADRKVLSELEKYPRCLKFRQTNHFAPRVFDFRSYSKSDRLLLLDSDVLFFAEPTELLNRIENPNYQYNSVNADVASAYTVDPTVIKEQMSFEVQDRFNAGLGLIHKQSLNLDWMEEFLGLPNIIGHFWRIEQTLFALCSSKYGVELLPEEYDVRLHKGINGSPSRHYVGAIRHLMYGEGIKQLMQQNFLQELS